VSRTSCHQRVEIALQAGDLGVQLRLAVLLLGDHLVAVVAVGRWQQRLVLGDLDAAALERLGSNQRPLACKVWLARFCLLRRVPDCGVQSSWSLGG